MTATVLIADETQNLLRAAGSAIPISRVQVEDFGVRLTQAREEAFPGVKLLRSLRQFVWRIDVDHMDRGVRDRLQRWS
jgi:hypothetical protein